VIDLNALNFEKGGGTVVVVTQNAVTGVVLMIAHADREALERTIESGEMHYRSRTRGLWHKGETSGNTQRVVSLSTDCDGDAVLARVVPNGPACHTGITSCFGEEALSADALGTLDAVIEKRRADFIASGNKSTESTGSYTQRLLADRNLRMKKIGEESAELVLASADGDKERVVSEAADLVYHVLVALRSTCAILDDLRLQLATRSSAFRPSSIP
jgi:phosphoribosyl-AMP cyclohydrolase / phosphoribosyl-ATP pyrophosphohydrolase